MTGFLSSWDCCSFLAASELRSKLCLSLCQRQRQQPWAAYVWWHPTEAEQRAGTGFRTAGALSWGSRKRAEEQTQQYWRIRIKTKKGWQVWITTDKNMKHSLPWWSRGTWKGRQAIKATELTLTERDILPTCRQTAVRYLGQVQGLTLCVLMAGCQGGFWGGHSFWQFERHICLVSLIVTSILPCRMVPRLFKDLAYLPSCYCKCI